MPKSPAEPTYGAAKTGLDARAALDDEIRRTAGAIEWLQTQVAALEPDQLTKGTKFVRTTTAPGGEKTTVAEAGVARHELLQLLIEERRHLHALCRDALAADQRAGAPPAAGGWPRAI